MQDNPWFVFAGGGTGGHLYPALAVVEALRARRPDAAVSFFCTDRPIDREILGKAQIEARPQMVQAFPARPTRWPTFLMTWFRSLKHCRQAFRVRRPTAVVGAGGYASGPPVQVAMKMGIPTFLLNPDAVPGRANRHMGAKASLTGIFAQWEVTKKYFPLNAPVEVVGCPVRRAFFEQVGAAGQAEALQSFGLRADRPMLLVTGASQGARTINEAMLLLADEVAAAGWQVLHLSGQGEFERMQQAYAAVRERHPDAGPFVVLAFTDRMGQAMTAADVVVSRAGASTLAELLVAGKPSILLPYPYHRDQHQRHNAEVLVDAGAAILMDDLKDGAQNAARLRPILRNLLTDRDKCAAMSHAAGAMGRPDAAEKIASRLLDCIEN